MFEEYLSRLAWKPSEKEVEAILRQVEADVRAAVAALGTLRQYGLVKQFRRRGKFVRGAWVLQLPPEMEVRFPR